MSHKSSEVTSHYTMPCRSILLIEESLDMLRYIFLLSVRLKGCCNNCESIMLHFSMNAMIVHYAKIIQMDLSRMEGMDDLLSQIILDSDPPTPVFECDIV